MRGRNEGAAHFAPPDSPLVFEPAAAGGLAVEPAAALLEAGLVAVGQFCARDGAAPPRWLASLEEAAEAHPQLGVVWEPRLGRSVGGGNAGAAGGGCGAVCAPTLLK